MSIESVFDPYSEEILKASALPEHAGGAASGSVAFPERVIITFSERILRQVASMEGAEEIGFLLAGSKVPVYRIPLGLNGEGTPKFAAVVRTGMGAPMAAAFMEELIAKGGRRFIVFGSCGLLTGGLPPGHVIVPDRAWRDEGTSYHYAPAADTIKLRNAFYIAGLLKGLDVPHTMGGIWTTDGLYRETVDNAGKRREAGCIAVDMECAALQAVCDFRGCELYQFVYAEDSLVDDQWDPRTMGKVPAVQMESHLQLAMEIARRV